jgi:MFS family permease
MSNWFTSMNVRERRTFAACFSGWALDAMDVQLYAVVMPTLIGLWGLSQTQAGTLGTAALLFSSVGGWIAGILADRFGRVAVLRLTILWFAFFTFLSAFTQSYEQLLLTRSLQGLGFGGEWAAGAVLMSEVIDKRIRGRAVGSVQGGWSVGYGTAVLLFTIVFSVARPEVAWRYLFMLGLIPALLVPLDPALRGRAAGLHRNQGRDVARDRAAVPGDLWTLRSAGQRFSPRCLPLVVLAATTSR